MTDRHHRRRRDTGASRPTTLHDVATMVGVSPRTVSRVVNHEGGFSDSTRDRVEAAIRELDYRPNLLARGLITRRTGTIALVVPTIADPNFAEVAEGVERAAREAGLTVVLATMHHDPAVQDDVISSLGAHSPDGLIVFPARERAEPLRPHLDRGMRMVVVDSQIDHPNAACISSDLRHGVELAVAHLRSTGRRRLAMLANRASPAENRVREDSFVAFADDTPSVAGRIVEPVVEPIDPTMAGGREGTMRLIGREPEIDGIFAYNDVAAIGAIQALRTMGRRVPDDVAVVGCDDIILGSVLDTPLTTIRLDRSRLGDEAVRLLEALADDDVDSRCEVVVPVELVVRSSA